MGEKRSPVHVPAEFGLQDVRIDVADRCFDGFLKIDRYTLQCRLYEGGWSQKFVREVLVRDPGIGVLLYDPVLDKVLMVEQFRIGCLDDMHNGPWALELVAGLLEPDETAESVARREAEEESGVQVSRLLRICEYYNSPGGSSEKLTVFCALFDAAVTVAGIYGLETESENIRSVILDRTTAVAAVSQGRINNAMSIIALQWLELNLTRVREALLTNNEDELTDPAV